MTLRQYYNRLMENKEKHTWWFWSFVWLLFFRFFVAAEVDHVTEDPQQKTENGRGANSVHEKGKGWKKIKLILDFIIALVAENVPQIWSDWLFLFHCSTNFPRTRNLLLTKDNYLNLETIDCKMVIAVTIWKFCRTK